MTQGFDFAMKIIDFLTDIASWSIGFVFPFVVILVIIFFGIAGLIFLGMFVFEKIEERKTK